MPAARPLHAHRGAGHALSRVEVRRADAREWASLREVRLATIADAPYAFGATYAEEAQSPRRSGECARELAYFVAFDGALPVGVAAGARLEELKEHDSDVRMLRAPWVSPSERGADADRRVDTSSHAVEKQAAPWSTPEVRARRGATRASIHTGLG